VGGVITLWGKKDSGTEVWVNRVGGATNTGVNIKGIEETLKSKSICFSAVRERKRRAGGEEFAARYLLVETVDRGGKELKNFTCSQYSRKRKNRIGGGRPKGSDDTGGKNAVMRRTVTEIAAFSKKGFTGYIEKNGKREKKRCCAFIQVGGEKNTSGVSLLEESGGLTHQIANTKRRRKNHTKGLKRWGGARPKTGKSLRFSETPTNTEAACGKEKRKKPDALWLTSRSEKGPERGESLVKEEGQKRGRLTTENGNLQLFSRRK